jgi:hypothetical protein
MRPHAIQVARTCAYCGSAFTVPDYKLPYTPAKFCSRSCKNAGRTIRPPADRFWEFVQKSESCWLWLGKPNGHGYGRFSIMRKVVLAHRYSWELAHGTVPAGLWVLHHCDNPPCVNPAHLWLGTHGDNMRDMVAKGRNGAITHPERIARGDRGSAHLHPESRPRGENHPHATFTEAQVLDIKRRLVDGERRLALAAAYRVSRGAIDGIASGRTWGHLRLA